MTWGGGEHRFRLIEGGIEFLPPNNYETDNEVVQPVADDVLRSRSEDETNAVWTPRINDTLKSVAVPFMPDERDGNIFISDTDLTVDSPATLPINLKRYYNSFNSMDGAFGSGWSATPAKLEFAQPQLKGAGLAGARVGLARFVDQTTGQVLTFDTSITIDWLAGTPRGASDANGNPEYSAVGTTDGSSLAISADRSIYTLTRPDQSQYIFDSGGHLIRQADRHGNSIDYSYTGGSLKSISDSLAQKISFTYDAHGRIKRAIGPAAEQVDYTYDETTGDLLSATRVRGNRQFTYGYDSGHRLSSATGPNGLQRLWVESDLLNRSVRQVDSRGNGYNYTYAFDRANHQRSTTVQDIVSGATSIVLFDQLNRPLNVTDPLDRIIRFGYDVDGRNPTSIQFPDPSRSTVQLQFDSRGNLTAIRDPENDQDGNGLSQGFVYDQANQLTEHLDARQIQTAFTYDTSGNLAAVTRGSDSWKLIHDGNGLLKSVANPLDETTTYSYDTRGNLISVRDANNAETVFQYNALSQLTTIIDSEGRQTVFLYNDHDQLVRVISPQGVLTYEYDPVTRRLMRQVDFNQHATLYSYDSKTGDLLTISDAFNAQYAYDRLGNLTRQTDDAGTQTVFQYDMADRVTAMKTGHGTLKVAIAAESVAENAGNNATAGTVTRANVDDLSVPLTVMLSSSDHTKVVPGSSSIEIPAGQASATFSIDVIDNTVSDGNGLVVILASTSGFGSGSDVLVVLDDGDGRAQAKPQPTPLSVVDRLERLLALDNIIPTILRDDLMRKERESPLEKTHSDEAVNLYRRVPDVQYSALVDTVLQERVHYESDSASRDEELFSILPDVRALLLEGSLVADDVAQRVYVSVTD